MFQKFHIRKQKQCSIAEKRGKLRLEAWQNCLSCFGRNTFHLKFLFTQFLYEVFPPLHSATFSTT